MVPASFIWQTILVAAIVLSGCIAKGPEDRDRDQNESSASQQVAFTTFTTGIACGSLCEPVIVSNGEHFFVKGDTLARGAMNHTGMVATGLEPFNPPPPPAQLGPGTFQTDRHLDVDAEGRLWFSALVAQSGLGATFTLAGVQVARSDDNGDTWAVDRYLGLAAPEPRDTAGADRQWLAFGPDGTAWLTFQRNSPAYVLGIPTVDAGNVWIASSRDGGETWSAFEPMDDEAGSGHASGRMVFAAETPLVPVHRSSGTSGLYLLSPAAPPVRVTGMGSFFPAVAPYLDAFLFAAMDAEQTLRVFTWDGTSVTPLWNGTAGAMISSPWIDVRDDAYDVVWYERTNGTEDRFDVLWSRDGAPPRVLDSGLRGDWGARANSDFAHFTYHDGRLLIVAGDNEENHLRFYQERPRGQASAGA